MAQDDYLRLKDDLDKNGYDVNYPIWVYEGQILDGWNRERACVELGIEPAYAEFTGTATEAIEFVMRSNKRRNLSSSQWATLAVEADEIIYTLKQELEAERRNKISNSRKGETSQLIDESNSNRTDTRVADMFNTNRQYIREAQKLKNEKPELFEAVKRGDKTITEVKREENFQLKKQREHNESIQNITKKPIIIHANCMDIFDKIPDIDLLIADPPYFTDGNFVEQVSKYLTKVKSTGQAYVFMSSDPNELLAYLNMNRQGMELSQILVWNYNNTGQRQPNVRYNSNYQICFYFRGVNAPDINKPADGKEQYACQTINAPDARRGERYFKWQKPDDLIEHYIKNSSNPGDFIFDPFAGSGTSLIIASKLGRIGMGCDVDEDMVKICIERGCEHE